MKTTTNNIIESLDWRYATKAYDTTRKIDSESLQILKDAVRLAPSSYGLQPYRVLVVSNEEIKSKLREKGYNQPQITDSSHLFIFAAKKSITSQDVSDYMRNISSTRGVSMDSVNGFGDYINGSISQLTTENFTVWNSKQTYIALGILVQTAAQLKIDATPMEGFDAAGFDEVLGLSELGLTTAVICATGYRSSEDNTQHYAKVRKPESELFQLV